MLYDIYNTDKRRIKVKTYNIEMLPALKPDIKNYKYIK